MKSLPICLSMLAFFFFSFATACSDSDAAPAMPEVVVAKTEFSFSEAGGTNSLSIKSNVKLDVTSNQAWCIVAATPTESASVLKYAVTVEPNPTADVRLATLTVTGGEEPQTVVISQAAGAPSAQGSMASDATALAAKIKVGWNLGNSLEAMGGETGWGNPRVTEAFVKQIKALGFNAVRIPCAWSQYIEDETTYKIKDSWLARVDEVVGYCANNDMYAIVNIHWDGGWLENNCTADKQSANNKKQKALWTQIANKLNHYDEHLLLAGCNEPNVEDAAQMAVLLSYEQTFVDAVRATGGNNALRNLIVQGPATDIDKTSKLFGQMPADVLPHRLMVEVHYYNPWTFCGLEKDESWGKMAYFWGSHKVTGSDRNAASGDEAEMKSLFAKMKTQFVDKKIPVILGEYGAMVRTGLGNLQEAHNQSRGEYDEVVTREAKKHGLVPFYWDGGTFAMISRLTGTVNDTFAYDGIMRGAQ